MVDIYVTGKQYYLLELNLSFRHVLWHIGMFVRCLGELTVYSSICKGIEAWNFRQYIMHDCPNWSCCATGKASYVSTERARLYVVYNNDNTFKDRLFYVIEA